MTEGETGDIKNSGSISGNTSTYAEGNPLKDDDPSGLILLAFNGTGSSENSPSGDSISNVLKFYQAYDQQANGKAYYITGIGTTNEDMPYQGNMANAAGFDQRVALGFEFLDKFMSTDTGIGTVDIDMIGFSRGCGSTGVDQPVGRKAGKGSVCRSWQDALRYLRFEGLYLPENDPQRPNFITGTVDMNGYLQWLKSNGYDINLTAQ